jgi:hypothetical protein
MKEGSDFADFAELGLTPVWFFFGLRLKNITHSPGLWTGPPPVVGNLALKLATYGAIVIVESLPVVSLLSKLGESVIAIVSTRFGGHCQGMAKTLGFTGLLLENGTETLSLRGAILCLRCPYAGPCETVGRG